MKIIEAKTIGPIRKKLAEREKLESELTRHREMEPTLRAEERKLLDSGELDNEEIIRAVATARTRIDMMPAKFRQYEAAIKAVDAELKPLNRAFAEEICSVIEEATRTMRLKIEAALKPFGNPDENLEPAIRGALFNCAIHGTLKDYHERSAHNADARTLLQVWDELNQLCARI
jgi:uncharacterized protein YhaN